MFNIAQMRKELLDVPESKTDFDLSKTKDISPLLAVQGVFYKCPLIGPDILTKQEWKIKIKEYLYEGLSEERGLASCLIIHSCNKNREKIEQCVSTLITYLQNIIDNPSEVKYQKIRLSNRIYEEKVSKLEGAHDFLLAAGFEIKKFPFKDTEEEYLVFNPEKSDVENLLVLIDALRNAEPINIELDRNVQILSPSQAAVRIQLPNDFFALTPEEIKREQLSRAERLESSMQLRTKAMREKVELRELKKYRYAVIRIRFPDGILLQGTFGVYEKFIAVREFVMESLENPDGFILKTALGQQFNDEDNEASLIDLRLVPAVMLIFEWENESSSQIFLKSDLMAYLQNL
ncbi:hypothetical protein AAG570_007766 [Ranatra chinensis]|uniref:UBX domain-containing protein n=1 Tax=Ranatra chinensis TaxID=642074 RepID=A0ABD0Y9R6_9HEMI